MTAKKLEDLLAGTMRGLGAADQAARTRRFAELLEVVGGEWGDRLEPLDYNRGILKVGVASSAALQEAVQFHGDAWLEALKAAGSPVKKLKFVLNDSPGESS